MPAAQPPKTMKKQQFENINAVKLLLIYTVFLWGWFVWILFGFGFFLFVCVLKKNTELGHKEEQRSNFSVIRKDDYFKI